ncbi:hypothetical protein RugamoR64_21320 [Duganella rhizosphaerae]|uniref:hypothetical protein n=1 Tax=Duganella rhizosphaerae TaxID=2885763 RepID=UPI0030E9CF68
MSSFRFAKNPSASIKKKPDFAVAGSPLQQKQALDERDREAHNALLRHVHLTGYLPKEYEIQRAADPDFDRAETAANKRALEEALERLTAWEKA